jgi:2-haloacid dehalogenase
MPTDRRGFLARIAGGVATEFLTTAGARAGTAPRFRALAFDAFTILDPRPIASLAEQVFPGKGAEFGNLWRTRHFEYTRLGLPTEELGSEPDAIGKSLTDLVEFVSA